MRTRAAKLAAAAQSLKQASGRDGAAFCLAFMTDRVRTPHPEIIARAMPAGSAVILRDYDNADRTGLARRLRSITEKNGVLLLIGADLALAQKIGADGVHYPSWAAVRANTVMITSAACHDANELARAHQAGADIALLSPVFCTDSHPGAATLGATQFKALAGASPLPVVALGGADETNAFSLRGKNVVGLAAISAFTRADA